MEKVPYPVNQPLIAGHYYELTYHFGITIPEAVKPVINFAITHAPEFAGPIAIKNIKYEPIITGGRRDGTDLVITFQALPHPTITESGFDLRAFMIIAGAILLGILAVNGTFKSFFTAVDTTASTASKVFDPAVIIGVIIILLIFSKMRS